MMLKLLDLFSGQGGAAKGYMDAGFLVTGVDILDFHKRYPGKFIQGDAIEYLNDCWREYDVIHASPVCKAYSNVTNWNKTYRKEHPDQIWDVRTALWRTQKPYVIENVVEAPLRRDLMLCGTMFGLRVKRHRIFELTHELPPPPGQCDHSDIETFIHKNETDYRIAMEVEWMSIKLGMRQAIPPRFTKYIGEELLKVLS